MNAFNKHPISNLHKKEQLEKKIVKAETWIHTHWILSLVAALLFLLTLKGVFGNVQSGHPISIKQILIEAVGDSLETDGMGHTNILLLGVGGEGHDGVNLTDTMIVATIDESANTVAMVSLPRDIYVDNKRVGWGGRLNGVYESIYDETEDPVESEAVLEEQIEEIMGLDIQYYAKIDFKGFTEIVDAVGGVTVTSTETIADDFYPAADGSGGTYDPFYLSQGTHTLDGETALKYVRSRHNTSDFSRALRQQQVLEALKDQALSLGVLTSPSKIKDVYAAISSNFETNMSLSEMLSLADVASNLEDDSIQRAVISDAAYETGGFLYTPEREEGDPFYLVPYAGDFSEFARFAEVFLYHPEIARDKINIRVLNGTKTEGLAGLTKMMLVRYGFTATYGNADDKAVQKTQIYIVPQSSNTEASKEEQSKVERTAQLLPFLIDGEISADIPPSLASGNEAQIVIVLGTDFAEYYKENSKLFYIGFY